MKCLKNIDNVPKFSDLSPQMGVFLRVTSILGGVCGRGVWDAYCKFLQMMVVVEMNFQEGNAII